MAFSRILARINRRAINPLVRTFAGRLPPFAVVVHRGRVSGRAYRTPVLGFPAGDRFLVALVYGAEADWVKNVLAQGGGEVVARRRTVAVTDPELRPADAVAAGVPAPVRAALRLLGTRTFLVLQRRTGAPDAV
jgi:deazaflavin-dependent oxidoreductase (nitroreductase family)